MSSLIVMVMLPALRRAGWVRSWTQMSKPLGEDCLQSLTPRASLTLSFMRTDADSVRQLQGTSQTTSVGSPAGARVTGDFMTAETPDGTAIRGYGVTVGAGVQPVISTGMDDTTVSNVQNPVEQVGRGAHQAIFGGVQERVDQLRARQER